jgi:hypothetical protein
MQEMAFQDFKFQTFSGRGCPQTGPVVMHPLWKTFTPLTNQARSTSAGQNAALESQEYHCNSSSLYRYLGVHFGIFSKACKTATSGQRVLDVVPLLTTANTPHIFTFPGYSTLIFQAVRGM